MLLGELEKLHRKISTLEHELAQLNKQISALHRSTSWRLTAPLRLLSRHLGWRTMKDRLLTSFRDWRAIRVIARSGLLDKKWYLAKNPDVATSGIDPVKHYVIYGAKEGRDPSPSFSTRGYLLNNSDVAAAGANPFEHFIRYGAKERRTGGFKSSSD